MEGVLAKLFKQYFGIFNLLYKLDNNLYGAAF